MKSTYFVAAGITLLLVVWLASGRLKSDPDMAAPAEQENAVQAAARVRVQERVAEPHVTQITVRGKTEAKRAVQVRAQTSGRIELLPVEKGQVVGAGDLLCKLALEDRQIKLQEAQAAVEHARLEHEGIVRLSRGGYQSETNIANSRVRLITAHAALERRKLDLQYIEIRAPFDGIVQDRPVNMGDLLERGGICAEVLDPDPLLIVGHVTEGEVALVTAGGAASVELATGERADGQITFISHAADATTRTYRIEVSIPNGDNRLRDGLSADIRIALDSTLAHRVSPALLALDDEGLIGIRILDDEDRVHFVNVEIISDTQDGVWLSGLPERIRLITVGQGLVFEGQVVDAVDIVEIVGARPQ